MMRFAHVAKAASTKAIAEVQAYLPSNYTVFCADPRGIVIVGEDSAGWTLDDYVIPRLGSGMIFAQEVVPVFTTEPHVGTVNMPVPETCFSFAKEEIERQVEAQ